MNLVKLQDDLKMLPMAVLQAKAQGQDPQVPPWLATAVLNERMDAQKKAGLAQGAQGEQPSIVEQLSQKAGLMALQGQQQQQAQQQMMSQMAQAPQPAPENVPQPEPQPEPQMMARGGLARLPVDSRMFDYRAGGIIGFAGEGEVPSADEGASLDAVKAQAQQAIANLQRYGLRQQQQDPEGYQRAQQAVKDAQQAVKNAMTQYQSSMEKSGMTKPAFMGQKPAPQATGSVFTPGSQSGLRPEQPTGLPSALPKPPPQSDVQIPMSPELRAAMEKDAAENGIANPQFNFRGPRGSTATLTPQAPQQPPPPPQAPAQPPAGLASLPPAAPQQTPIEMARAASEAFPMARKEPSLQGILDIEEKARQAAGAKRAGEAEQEQLTSYQAETERLRKARDEANAMETLSGYGGLAGLGQRRAAIMQRDNLADTIRNDATEKMRLAMEGMKQAKAAGNVAAYNAEKEKYISAQDARANASITATNELAKQRMQSTTQERGQDIQAETAAKQVGSEEKRAAARDITDRRGQDLHLQAAKLTTAAADARATRDEKRQTLQELSTIGRELGAEIGKIDPMISTPQEKARRAVLQKDLDAVRAAIAAMGGNVTLQSGSPTMAPPPGAVREVKK